MRRGSEKLFVALCHLHGTAVLSPVSSVVSRLKSLGLFFVQKWLRTLLIISEPWPGLLSKKDVEGSELYKAFKT